MSKILTRVAQFKLTDMLEHPHYINFI